MPMTTYRCLRGHVTRRSETFHGIRCPRCGVNGDERVAEVVEYTTWGPVREQGPIRSTYAEARADLVSDARGCISQGGYTDRRVVAVSESGRLVEVDDEGAPTDVPVWPSHGRSSGAVRIVR